MKIAQLWKEQNELVLRFEFHPFDSALLRSTCDRLKEIFTGRSRRYDNSTKTWHFDVPSYTRLREFLQEQGFVIEDSAFTQADIQLSAFVTVLARFSSDARTRLMKAFYKVMALEAHPDRGGDTALMQAVNSFKEVIGL